MTNCSQLDNGGGVGAGVVVTVVCKIESRDAERLKSRSNVTASRSVVPFSLPLPIAFDTSSSFASSLSTSRLPLFLAPFPLPLLPVALIPAHCTVPPSPTVLNSHFCLPLFFFFRLKKQQHLEIKQILIGLRIVCQCFIIRQNTDMQHATLTFHSTFFCFFFVFGQGVSRIVP